MKEIDQDIAKIMEECRMHNDAIGESRDEDRLRSDARYIKMHREGVTAETLCMMLTDTEFALRRERESAQKSLTPDAAFQWTQELPTEEWMYWHWGGHPNDRVSLFNVVRGSDGEFCVRGVSTCKQLGGWWRKIPEPDLPQV